MEIKKIIIIENVKEFKYHKFKYTSNNRNIF